MEHTKGYKTFLERENELKKKYKKKNGRTALSSYDPRNSKDRVKLMSTIDPKNVNFKLTTKSTRAINFDRQSKRDRDPNYDPRELKRNINLEYNQKEKALDSTHPKIKSTNFTTTTSREDHFITKLTSPSKYSMKKRKIIPLEKSSTIIYDEKREKTDNCLPSKAQDFSKSGRESKIIGKIEGGKISLNLSYPFEDSEELLKPKVQGYVDFDKHIERWKANRIFEKEKKKMMKIEDYDTFRHENNQDIKTINMAKTTGRETKIWEHGKKELKQFRDKSIERDKILKPRIKGSNIMYSNMDGRNGKLSIENQIKSADSLLKHADNIISKLK